MEYNDRLYNAVIKAAADAALTGVAVLIKYRALRITVYPSGEVRGRVVTDCVKNYTDTPRLARV